MFRTFGETLMGISRARTDPVESRPTIAKVMENTEYHFRIVFLLLRAEEFPPARTRPGRTLHVAGHPFPGERLSSRPSKLVVAGPFSRD